MGIVHGLRAALTRKYLQMRVHATRYVRRYTALLALVTTLVAGTAVLTSSLPRSPRLAAAPGSQDWPTFLHDNQRSSASGETILSSATAPILQKQWAYLTGGGVAASPTIVGGVVYVGSWDGYEYAIDANLGTLKWKTFLGQTTAPCNPNVIGVTSAATVLNGVVYVGGGDSYWYALDATTGNVLWKVFSGDNSLAGAHYNWSSPLIYNGFAYIGVASNCDNPLVQGQLLQVNLTTQQVVNTFNFVPAGQVGGGVWTSPTVDPATNTIFITTGTQNLFTQNLPQAIVALDATTLALKSSWQIPPAQTGIDSDWGTTPSLVTDLAGDQLVAATNKNGIFYVFQRANLSAGPVWQRKVALGGECPPCGDGSISSAAFANNVLYVGGGNTTIGGVGYQGYVRAFDPATGNLLWEHGTDQPVFTAIAYVNGLLAYGEGQTLEVLDATTGHSVYTYLTGGAIYSAPSVWNGSIYVGSGDNKVYSFATSTVPGGSSSGVQLSNLVVSDTANIAKWSLQTNIQVGAVQYGDRTYTLASVPTGLAGAAWIRTANASKTYTGTPTVTFTIDQQATVYVALDSRLAQPAWMDATWSLTAVTLTNNQAAGANTFAVYAKVFPAGSVALGPNSTTGNTAVNMYTVIVVGTGSGGGTPTPAPTPTSTPTPGGSPTPTPGGPVQLSNLVVSDTANAAKWSLQLNLQVGVVQYGDRTYTLTTLPSALLGAAWVRTAIASKTYTGTPTVTFTIDQQATVYVALDSRLVKPTWIDASWTPTGQTLINSEAAGANTFVLYAKVFPAGSVALGPNSSTGNTTVNMYSVIVSNGAPSVAPSDPNCPVGFTCQDINSPASGSESVANGTWTVTAAGAAIHGASDQFRFISQSATGDTQISAEVLTQSTQDTTPQAGIMVRQSTDPTSPFYAMVEYPNNNPENEPLPTLRVWYRTGFGLNAIQSNKYYPTLLPNYFMIQRVGNVFSASISTDGVNWQLLPGSEQDIVMPWKVLDGVAQDSGLTATTGTASYAHVTIGAPTTPPAPIPPQTPCPAAWSCLDVGDPAPAGDQTLNNGTWTLQGAGQDIAFYSDQFHFVWQTLTGDETISADVTSQTNTSPFAKAGLMIRQSLDPGSPYYGIFVTPSNGIIVQYRAVENLRTFQVATLAGTAPVYFQVAHWTDTSTTPATEYYTAYTSADGLTWTAVPWSTTVVNMSGSLLVGMAASAHAIRVLSPATFTNVTVSNTAPLPPTLCPGGWTCGDIGYATPPGNQAVSNGVWTVQGGGNDIWSVYDQFRYEWQTLAGDGTVSAHITAQTNTDPWAKAGVMLRATTDGGSPYYAAFVTPGNGITIQYRPTQGGFPAQLGIPGAVPAYLQVARWTDTRSTPATEYFTTYTSPDGITWTEVAGSTVNLNMTGSLLAGLAVTSHNAGFVSTATFDTVQIGTTAPVPLTACPTGWSCADIGNPTPPGSQLNTNGTWTVKGGGGDIWGTADAFHFVGQSLAADGTVSAHVTAQTATDPWAKAGVMLRATTDPGSAYYAVFVTPSNGLAIQYRPTQGGASSQLAVPGTLPTYLLAARFTDTSTTPAMIYYTAYTSTDGVSWTAIPGSSIQMNLTGALLAGMAVTSHNAGLVSAATFDTVGFSTTPPPAPAACVVGWSCADIGNAIPAGSQTLSNGTWTVKGGGGDIWGASDAFHFVWQSLAADGSVSAHITAQTVSDPWAKAGVMLRATTDPGSAYYAAFVTPSNGLAIQYRPTQGAASTQISIAGTVPTYLQVARYTDASTTPATVYYTTYTSTDGVTWVPVTGTTVAINMTGTLLAGLAVTSHNAAALSAVTFDTVVVGTTSVNPPGICPNGWTCADIGGPTPAGSQTLSNGTWTVQGGGGDIWDPADGFHFVWQPLAANGSVSAHITAQTVSDPWAKAGVMLRATTDPVSAYYAAFITPGNGLAIQYRPTQGAPTSQILVPGTLPAYLQVARVGTTFTAYTSSDGVTWTAVPGSTVTLASITGSALAGLAVTSHNNAALCTVVADTVSVKAS
jgi:outer membrane protein assembly factor BamB